MTYPDPIVYSTDGAPLVVGSVESVQHWSGTRDNGGGITVVYGGIGVETLPKEFAQTKKKGGKRTKRFATAAEATTFEQELLKRLLKIHPGAKRPSRYPDYSGWYVGTEEDGVYPTEAGVFGIERRFTSDYSAMTKKLTDVTVIPFNKKKKASALFVDMEGGGGSGELAIATTGDELVIARVITVDGDRGPLIASLDKPKRRTAQGTLELSASVVIFNAALAASEIAQHNWQTTSLVEGFQQATRTAASGPLRVPDQQPAGGAYFSAKPGTYAYAVDRNRKTGGTVFDALRLWRKA